MISPNSLLIVVSFPCREERKQFLTHIPIRIRELLGPDVVITLVYSGELESISIQESGITLYPLSIKADRWFRWRLFFSLRQVISVVQPQTIMNLNDYRNNWIFALWGSLYGAKCVARVTGNAWVSQPRSWKAWVLRLLQRSVETVSLLGMNRVICLSQALTQILPVFPIIKSKAIVLSPGIDPLRFNSTASEVRDIDLLFVGRFEPIKNLALCFEIFEHLLKHIPSAQFHLVGKGSEVPYWKKCYESHSRVIFHGERLHSEISAFMNRAKSLCLCSHSEGFPNVVLESMSCGAIPVVTPISDMLEIVGRQELGVLVNPLEPEKAAESLATLLKDETERQKMATRAREYVLRKHSLDVLRPQYRKVLFDETMEASKSA